MNCLRAPLSWNLKKTKWESGAPSENKKVQLQKQPPLRDSPCKKKNAFAHTVPLAQFIQILNNYTVSVLSSVFINSKISCWFVYDRKIMNNTIILSKCIVISCVTIHSCKLWMLSGVWHLWSVLNIQLHTFLTQLFFSHSLTILFPLSHMMKKVQMLIICEWL